MSRILSFPTVLLHKQPNYNISQLMFLRSLTFLRILNLFHLNLNLKIVPNLEMKLKLKLCWYYDKHKNVSYSNFIEKKNLVYDRGRI